MAVASSSDTTRGEGSEGVPGSCKDGVTAGREGKGSLRKRPQESGGISGRTGETTPAIVRLVSSRRTSEGKKERKREAKGGSERRGRVGGCKCPRDVSDRCGSIQTPPALLRDLKTFSEAGMSYGYPFPFIVISCRPADLIRVREIRGLRCSESP